jgi:GTP-binding protein HflX
MSRTPQPTRSPRERVFVCGVRFPGDTESDLEEACSLVEAAEGVVVGEGMLQHRQKPEPATLLGKGKVQEVQEEFERHRPDAVVVDNDLSPAQVRNLEKAWGKRVIDRSELILDIFSRRARTRQARLQVELAQTEYLFPRLRRMWTHLERTEGAIGTRGPGETQLETDQRLLRKRIRDLKADLRVIEERKQRELRTRSDQFSVGLVGYTNAGKSTLMNRLTGADVFVADMPFATLDTRTRSWHLPDGRMLLLSDTVGFLRRLPHHLVASFHATLEETIEADLLLHVVDASHPQAREQMEAVQEVLAELSHSAAPSLLVFNKIDQATDPAALHLLPDLEGRDYVYLSAKSGEGVDRLQQAVMTHLDRLSTLIEVEIPATDGRTRALLREQGGIVEEESFDDGRLRLLLRLRDAALGSLGRLLGEGVNTR